jgi:hypothetical protein
MTTGSSARHRVRCSPSPSRRLFVKSPKFTNSRERRAFAVGTLPSETELGPSFVTKAEGCAALRSRPVGGDSPRPVEEPARTTVKSLPGELSGHQAPAVSQVAGMWLVSKAATHARHRDQIKVSSSAESSHPIQPTQLEQWLSSAQPVPAIHSRQPRPPDLDRIQNSVKQLREDRRRDQHCRCENERNVCFKICTSKR